MTITNGYCTLDQLAAVRQITDTYDDQVMEWAIEEASRRIDAECGRTRYGFVASAAGTAVYAADNPTLLVVDDTVTVTTLKTDDDGDGTFETTWATTDYQLEPLGAATGIAPQPYTVIRAVGDRLFPRHADRRAGVQVVGTHGWSATPDAIRGACVMLAHRLASRHHSPLGVTAFGDLGVGLVRNTDPDVAALVAAYRRHDAVRMT
jgi:hypothetical protein